MIFCESLLAHHFFEYRPKQALMERMFFLEYILQIRAISTRSCFVIKKERKYENLKKELEEGRTNFESLPKNFPLAIKFGMISSPKL